MALKTKLNKALIINKNWCKGCGICIEVCPKDVLELRGHVLVIKDLDSCIQCSLCELKCPDYAIYLKEDDEDED